MMKKLLLFITLLTFSVGHAQKIQWMTINEAMAAQAKNPKKIFVDMYTNWCGPCKLLDRNTFSNADVAAYINENFYPVKFNAEGDETVKFKEHVFTNPTNQETEDYISGRFG